MTKTPLGKIEEYIKLIVLTYVQMLVLANGQERTLEQHEKLFEKSGWKFTKVTKGTYFADAELRKISAPLADPSDSS